MLSTCVWSMLRLYSQFTQVLVWALRTQAPADHGTADTSTIHALVLRDAEADAVRLDPTEDHDARLFTLDHVLTGDSHPALQRAILESCSLGGFALYSRRSPGPAPAPLGPPCRPPATPSSTAREHPSRCPLLD